MTYPTYFKSILITQKKIVRIITFSEHRAPSEPLFKSLCTLNFLVLSFIFQWIHHLTPANFNNYFQFASSVHQYSTRQVSNNNIYIKSVNSTQYGLRSVQITGPSLWNSLPVNLKNCLTVPCNNFFFASVKDWGALRFEVFGVLGSSFYRNP